MPSASALSGRLQAGGVLAGVERVFLRARLREDLAMRPGPVIGGASLLPEVTDAYGRTSRKRNGGGIARRGS
jgi:hypothetical protein